MRFQKGVRFPYFRRRRGRGRGCYDLSDAALAARRGNLAIAEARGRLKRLRCRDETLTIKLLVWQNGPRLSLRSLGRQLGVSHVYVHKIARTATSTGWDARIKHGKPVTLADLEQARQVTKELREQEPGLLAPAPTRRLYEGEARGERRFSGAMTADEIIAEQRGFAEEWKRKNPVRYEPRLRFRFSAQAVQ